ncbi:MAG: aminotransferase class I/II-fold pyridoxal phosphate-dependent enzyme [Bacteroidota bacterium]
MYEQPIIATADRLGEVKEYYFSTKLREIARMNAAGKQVINLGIGSPDMSPPKEVLETLAIESQRTGVHGYQSYVGIPELRTAFADWYRTHFKVELDAATEVLPLIGSKEGIMHISMTYLQAGDEVLIPNPGYPAYRAVANLTGAKIREYKLAAENSWLPDLKALAQEDLSKVKIMWVNYPHMPTGTQANEAFYKKLIAFAKEQQILVCNDNPYSFILNDNPFSILSVEGAKEVALELNSLSKAHNMAGWRIGMLGGASHYIQNILRFKSNMDSGMFRPVQLAAVKALSLDKKWYQTLNKAYRQRQQKAFELMDLLDCQYDKNQTGLFVWAKIPAKYKNAFELSDEILYGANVFITPGSIFGSQGDQYIRASLCSTVEVFEESINRIKKL